MRHLLLLLLLLGSGAMGCHQVRGQITTTTEVHATRVAVETVTDAAPDLDRVDLTLLVEDAAVMLRGEHVRMCRERTVETYRNEKQIIRKLPGSHWALFGVGVGFAGGGGVLLGLGGSKVATGNSIPLGDPAHEQSLDTGHVLLPVGAAAATLGVLALISEIADIAKARDEIQPLPDSTETVSTREVECGRETAAGLEVRFIGTSRRYTVELDEDGWARVPVTAEALGDLGYRVPYAQVTCTGCDALSLTLPPDLTGPLVLSRLQLDEMKRWLEDNPTHRMANSISQARVEKIAEFCATVLEESRSHLDELEYDRARSLAGTCLDKDPAHTGALALMVDADRAEARAKLAESKRLARAGQFYAARTMAQHCAGLDSPSQADCNAQVAYAEERISAIRPTRVAVLQFNEEPGGWVLQVGLVNASGEHVAAEGSLSCNIVTERHGFATMKFPMGRYELAAAEYETLFSLSAMARVPIWTHRFTHAEFNQLTSPVSNYPGRAFLKDQDWETDLYFEVVFSDPQGHQLLGRVEFFVL